MAFSYDPGLNDAVSRVRFYTTDTDPDGYWLEDETITALVASQGGETAAVTAAFDHIIGKLSRPDFKADWLQVSNAKARQGFEALRARWAGGQRSQIGFLGVKTVPARRKDKP
jgi:hypothetical protein